MINAEDLTYSYAAADEPAVRGLSFHIDKGEIFGFLGPSGAGKSTTQKILIGLLRGYEGTVDTFGVDLSQWRSDYYERIGVSFEVPNHYLKLTALENLQYFGSLYQGDIEHPEALLESVGLEMDGELMVSQYSKGMKNRLNIARALMNHPELLFLDEPTTGLDPVNARRIKDLIRVQQAEGVTVFLTTHDMSVADELCDRVAFILDGEIDLIESPHDLKIKYGREFVRVEFQANGKLSDREFPLKGLGQNQDFLTLASQQKIQTIHSQEATLEDVFIQVTGRSLS